MSEEAKLGGNEESSAKNVARIVKAAPKDESVAVGKDLGVTKHPISNNVREEEEREREGKTHNEADSEVVEGELCGNDTDDKVDVFDDGMRLVVVKHRGEECSEVCV